MTFFAPRDVVLPLEPFNVAAVHDEYEKSLPRFADAYMALVWRLARAPDRAGAAASRPGWRVCVQAADPDAGTPEIQVLYTFDAQQVVIRDLRCPEAG